MISNTTANSRAKLDLLSPLLSVLVVAIMKEKHHIGPPLRYGDLRPQKIAQFDFFDFCQCRCSKSCVFVGLKSTTERIHFSVVGT